MKSQTKRGARGGFTLIEMLVVVVILGVILVASIPAIGKWLPRYRLERVSENLAQAIRIAHHGAVKAHCNHVLRLYDDRKRTIPMSGNDVLGFDIFLDRNNNNTVELPPGGTDVVTAFEMRYSDVVIHPDPDQGTQPINKDPYNAFQTAPAEIVFRADGRIYENVSGDWVALPQLAFLVESLTLPGTALADPVATFRFRWVELDPTGAVRVLGKGQRGN